MTADRPMRIGNMSFMPEEFSFFPVYICLSSTKDMKILQNRWCFDLGAAILLSEEVEIVCKK
jgi:hypothetical protein